jgi:hypothetical protein
MEGIFWHGDVASEQADGPRSPGDTDKVAWAFLSPSQQKGLLYPDGEGKRKGVLGGVRGNQIHQEARDRRTRIFLTDT